jgi:S-adenosylmethionine hydrolase
VDEREESIVGAKPVITLTTDFGHKDAYVGAMKGVLLTRSPGSTLVDISHEIPPQDVFRAAWVLRDSVRYFPQGTVHVVVVDPGVGTTREILIVQWGTQIVVAPDNGVLSLLLQEREDWRCFRLDRSEMALSFVSNTFHGRDLFAPVAAALASGETTPEECGPIHEPHQFEVPAVVRGKGMIEGQILTADGFGNLITNIDMDDLGALEGPVKIHIEGHPVDRVVSTYGEAQPGDLVALIGSSGWLEIAVVDGSAAERLALEKGTVTLSQS